MNFFNKEAFKGGIKSLAAKTLTLATNAASNAKKMIVTKEEPQNHLSDLTFIYPRIFWMTFPSKEKIKDLSETLNTQFTKNNYYVWNVGEQKYDTSLFNNQVAEYSFVGYPCPPFQYILLIIKSILEWLNSDKDNVAVIHCSSTGGRSAIIVSCLLSLLKVVNHPMEALTYFCEKLNINDTSFLLPSQKLCIKQFANLMDNIQLSEKSVVLQKITMNEVPQLIEDSKNSKGTQANEVVKDLRPYIQVFRGSKAIFNQLSKEKQPKAYTPEDKDIEYEINVEVTDDVLIRCRNYKSEEERGSVFRILFIPCFSYNEVLRLYKREIDFSTHTQVSNDFYIELFLKPGEEVNPEIATIKKLKTDCVNLAEEYRKKKDKSLQKIVTPQKEEDIKNKFDIVDSSKENSESAVEGSEDGSRDSREILTPNTDNKLKQFFTSIQQDDPIKEDREEDDLDDYISKLEKKEQDMNRNKKRREMLYLAVL